MKCFVVVGNQKSDSKFILKCKQPEIIKAIFSKNRKAKTYVTSHQDTSNNYCMIPFLEC